MNIDDALQTISRGSHEIIGLEQLRKKLASGKPLVVKAGFDPTAPDIHLGHVVLLRKMRQFQDLGHSVVFLIGDFTAQIGDPTGRNELRKRMTPEDVAHNAQTYKEQVFKVLDPQKTQVVFNSAWFSKFSAQELMSLSAHVTVAQMLARADFKKRFEDAREISILEFIYPLLQGYDSVVLKADVELGGSDQKFNLLMGRQIQQVHGQSAQAVVMTPLLEGLDGVNKMSKSLGNYIGINEAPNDIFGKLMSISDELMTRYFELLTDEDMSAVKAMHPRDAKVYLATIIVTQFHGSQAGIAARENFENIFSRKQDPADAIQLSLSQAPADTLELLVQAGLAESKNEARRLFKQGAISLDGEVLAETAPLHPGMLKVGKKRFLKLV